MAAQPANTRSIRRRAADARFERREAPERAGASPGAREFK
jgi:hypothetical protein